MTEVASGSAQSLCGVYNESCPGLVIPSCLKQRLVLRCCVWIWIAPVNTSQLTHQWGHMMYLRGAL